jgi:hypothetical protein
MQTSSIDMKWTQHPWRDIAKLNTQHQKCFDKGQNRNLKIGKKIATCKTDFDPYEKE